MIYLFILTNYEKRKFNSFVICNQPNLIPLIPWLISFLMTRSFSQIPFSD